MGRKSPAIPATLLLLLAASGVLAQGDVTHCVGIEDAQARLACFDAATRGASPATAGAAAAATSTAPPKAATGVTAPAPTVPATASADASKPAEPGGSAEFGLAERKETPEKITATVRSVESHTVPGRWVVTLDNDQVWEQRETTAANRRPKPGDSVTIEPSSFGSYLMVTTGRGSSRVKRIR